MDFVLETAWPNAWESMAFFLDALMLFVDYTPDAPANTLRVEPKLPTAWDTMTYHNLLLGDHRIDVTAYESPGYPVHHGVVFTNRTGQSVDYDTHIRIPAGSAVLAATANDATVAYTHDPITGRVHVTGSMAVGAGATTDVRVYFGLRGDANGDGDVTLADYAAFGDCLTGPGGEATPACVVYDLDLDADVDLADFADLAGLIAAP